MSHRLRVRDVQIYRLAIPLRFRFEHAAAAREVSDPVVMQLVASAPYAQFVGLGETLARPYVTGETQDSVVEDLVEHFVPRLTDFRADSFASALEFAEALPTQIDGRVVTAARAAFEIAVLDLSGQVFRRRLAEAAGWLGLPGFGPPGCAAEARYSGMILGRTPSKMVNALRVQRCYGLRDFKIKVAVEGWEQQLEMAHRFLKRPLEQRAVTLRADANAGWSLNEANEALEILERCGVSALEQPFSDAHDADLPWLAEQSKCDLIVDESLLTLEDADRLIKGGGVRVFNIRLAKNGGLLPSLRIARMAAAAGIDVQLGCLVGETSILTAAGVAFLEAVPKVRFVEGAFGRFLLQTDLTKRSLRFGRRGYLRPPQGFGLGVEADLSKLNRLAIERPKQIHL